MRKHTKVCESTLKYAKAHLANKFVSSLCAFYRKFEEISYKVKKHEIITHQIVRDYLVMYYLGIN